MSDLSEATIALIGATEQIVVTKSQFLDWAVGSLNGGPNGDGRYPFTQPDGTDVLVPCPTVINAQVQAPYDMGFRFNSSPNGSEVIDFLVTTVHMSIPANMTNSRGYVNSVPAASYQLALRLGGTLAPTSGTLIGSIVIATDGTFSFATLNGLPVDVPAGAMLKLVAPTVQDVGIGGVALTIRGGHV